MRIISFTNSSEEPKLIVVQYTGTKDLEKCLTPGRARLGCALQKDVDEWLEFYNQERPHSGRYCYGKAPMQPWRDSLHLAKVKQLNQHVGEKINIKYDLTPLYGTDLPHLSDKI